MPAPSSARSSVITAESLVAVHEPLAWRLDPGSADATGAIVTRKLRRALLGPYDPTGTTPSWLMPHQKVAWRRLRAILGLFRGGLLCDSVGLGKTYVALALGVGVTRVTAVVPASVTSQWSRVSRALRVPVAIVSHEALSRGRPVPASDLILVDEAHRFRNPDTHRYDRLCRSVGNAALLLITATPVVNSTADLVRLLQLFLPDHGLALFGVPSLEGVLHGARVPAFSSASSLVMVSRTRESASLPPDAIPISRDEPVRNPPPMSLKDTDLAISCIRKLRFPSFRGERTQDLLRLHLLLRLSSSAQALLLSLTNHCRFLDGAITRGEKGERLDRRELRRLTCESQELQLDLLELLRQQMPPLDVSAFRAERVRMAALVDAVRRGASTSPKQDELNEILGERAGRKTVVFTGAIATAHTVAKGLGWRRVAVVTGRGARIASGRVGIQKALDLFAPHARGRHDPPAHRSVDVLVATDLASEGVNLQDADAIVHYDLPWTPLRLQQRLGRIARLGSRHNRALTLWFVPPPELELHLALSRRLEAKTRIQQRHGVPVSSQVGRGRVLGISFERRERLATWTPERSSVASHHTAVHRGSGSVAAVSWRLNCGNGPDRLVRELIAWRGARTDAPEELQDLGDRCVLLEGLLAEPTFGDSPTARSLAGLRTIVKNRIRSATLGPRDLTSRRLARRIARHARRAGKQRREDRMVLLDAVLTKVAGGLPIGALREIHRLVGGHVDWVGLHRWRRHWPNRDSWSPSVRLEALLEARPDLEETTRPAPSRRSSPVCEVA